jgi:hypothetical protein
MTEDGRSTGDDPDPGGELPSGGLHIRNRIDTMHLMIDRGRIPAPSGAIDAADYVARLNQLLVWAGRPPLRRLTFLAGRVAAADGHGVDRLPRSTASDLLSGRRLPKLPRMELVEAFVTACLTSRRVPMEQIEEVVAGWAEAWQVLAAGGEPTAEAPNTAAASTVANARRPGNARPVAPPRQLPPSAVDFVGREVELAELRALGEDARHGPVIGAITGCGGVGKSALAIHAAHDLAARYPDGQLYVDLHGSTCGRVPLLPADVLGRFLRALGVDHSKVPGGTEEASARFRSLAIGKRLLVVLDNASTVAQVRPLLPAEPGCGVLVTSREILATLEGAAQLHLDALPPNQAVMLLARLAGERRVAARPAAAAAIARACDHLPLALRIAGARLAARPAWPLTVLAERLNDTRTRLQELEVNDLRVRASIRASYQPLHASHNPPDQDAARGFRLLGLLSGPDVRLEVAALLFDRPLDAAEAALERLVDARLLETTSPRRYRVRDLLRLFADEQGRHYDTAAERTAASARVLGADVTTTGRAGRLPQPMDHRPAREDPGDTVRVPPANTQQTPSRIGAERPGPATATLPATALLPPDATLPATATLPANATATGRRWP